jgi:hypothetical protein
MLRKPIEIITEAFRRHGSRHLRGIAGNSSQLEEGTGAALNLISNVISMKLRYDEP